MLYLRFLNAENLWGRGLLPTTYKKGNVLLTSELHVEYGVFAGDYRVFRDDVVFWVTFSSVALMIPVLFVGCPRIVSNLTVASGGGRKGSQTS